MLDREAHLGRVGEIAWAMTDAGIILVASLGDVDRFDLDRLRRLAVPHEVYVVGMDAGGDLGADLELPRRRGRGGRAFRASPPPDTLLAWLREDDPAQLERLWAAADETRSPPRRRRGAPPRPHRDQQPLRARLRLLRPARRQPRDRALPHERRARSSPAPAPPRPTAGARWCCSRARTTAIKTGWIAGVVRSIKAETGLAVTLSLGERPEADLSGVARRPAPTATCCASRPPTRSSTGSSTPICPAVPRAGSDPEQSAEDALRALTAAGVLPEA